MAKTVQHSFRLPVDMLPTGFVARSHDGHLFEVDFNQHNGIIFFRYPDHFPTLYALSRVLRFAEETGFLSDLRHCPERLLDGTYTNIPFNVPVSDGMEPGFRIFIADEGEV